MPLANVEKLNNFVLPIRVERLRTSKKDTTKQLMTI